MTSLTVSDILIRVQRTFGDEAAVQVTGDDVLRWINDAQQEAANQILDLLPVVGYIDTVLDQPSYTVPVTMKALKEVYYKDSTTLAYFQLRYMSMYQLSQVADGWDGAVYPSYIPALYTREADKLTIFPIPRETFPQGIKIHYSRYPVALTDTDENLDLPEYLDQYVVDFCMNRAYEMDEDWEAADRTANRVQSILTSNVTTPEARMNQTTYPTVGVPLGDYSQDAL